MAAYDLLTEKWIPASLESGEVEELGLLEVLERAHELTGLVDPAPSIQFGLYRLLIVFLTEALAVRELDDLIDRLAAGPLDMAEIERYADQIGRERFDLFHPRHPFLQSPPLPGDAEKPKSVADLFFHLPTGINVTHFHHMREHEHALSPAVCARGLCAIAPFMTSGGAGYSPSINGTPPWYVLVRGKHLLETLLLNCYVLTDAGLPQTEPPAWVSEKPFAPRQETACDSLAEGLTWRARQIRFIPGDGGSCTYTGRTTPILVRQMIYGPGLKFGGGDNTWTDPQVAYSETEKGRLPLRPREEREPWRDTGPLLLLRKADYSGPKGRIRFERPLVVDQFRRMKLRRYIPWTGPERFELYGVRADKAKVFEWRCERLSLPPGVGENERAGLLVQTAVEQADGVAYALRTALKQLYPREGGGNSKALEQTIGPAQTAFWNRIRLHFDRDLLVQLGAQPSPSLAFENELMTAWKKSLYSEGWRTLEEAIGPFDTGADALRRQVSARDAFGRVLAALLGRTGSEGTADQERRKAKA